MELYELTVHELMEKLEKNEITSEDIIKSYSKRIDEKEKDVQAFVTVTADEALKQAESVDRTKSKLAGIPIGIKDNMCTKGVKTTCSSKMLENFVAPYNATVVEKLNNEGVLSLGKLNMDEFAMGASTEYSAFKVTRNPWNLKMAPGGSSGGSAAAVASQMVPWALGSDTGGSIRQPAALCGVVGLKPTYGLVSRYGLVAFASSLDQIGPITQDVTDSAILLNVLAGFDEKDSTSENLPKKDYTKSLVKDVINGFFILFEDQYGVGDYVTIGKFSGIVETMGLRTTIIKDLNGDVHLIPNGSVTEVTNHSKGNIRFLVDVEIAYEEDINRAIDVITNECKIFEKENKDIKEPIEVWGVTSLNAYGITIRVAGRSKPLSQWKMERDLRKKLKEAIDKAGIEIPYPKTEIINKDK